jgi:N-acetylglucosamine kinase-like BadF-type ATPase
VSWILGIDGGGTKTVGCMADRSGKVLGQAAAGPANYHTVGLEGLRQAVAVIVEQACAKCDLDRHDLELISLGLAGVDRDQDRAVVLATLQELGLGCRYIINNDARIALAAGLGGEPGIVLIAGTGSIAYGVNKQSEIIRAGGWGHVCSDEGSGYDIARQALVRVCKAREQREAPSVLLEGIMAYWRIADWDALISFIYSPATGKTAIAALTTVVASAAAAGDALAQAILEDAAAALADLADSVRRRGFGPHEVVPVVTGGSVLENIAAVRQGVACRLAGKATLVWPRQQPVMGALALGLASLETGR